MPLTSPHRTTPDPTAAALADAREFDDFALAQDPPDIEAATWVARSRNGLDADGEARLQAWLNADPGHRAAFEDMAATLAAVQRLPEGDVASLRRSLQPGSATAPAAQPAHERRSKAAAKSRRWDWLRSGRLLPQAVAVVMVLALVGGGWMGWERWRQGPTFEQAYASGRGQQIVVQLPDGSGSAGPLGSTLQLDTATRVQARLFRDRRELRLEEGQALFSVWSDAGRPFHVWAGPLRITVVGTRFSVRHTATGLGAGQTLVSVEEGRVRVAYARQGGDAIELTAGQAVAADASGRIGAVSPAITELATWRDGRISFDHTPLGQALAEFERYGRTGLVVHDPRVAAMPVGGSYSVGQFQRFVQALPQVLPVRLVARGDHTEIVAR